jgi:LacI family transcriptional regulator
MGSNRRTTLVDVAQAAGVSPSTASRVLNGGAPVAPALHTRVRQAADELGYRPNPQARSLRTGRDTTIGLVVEDFNVELFARISSAVAAASEERGVQVVIATSGTGGSERHGVEALASRNVSGLVVVEGQAGAEYLEQVGRTLPTVVVDAARPHPTVDTVTVDNHGGGRWAAQRLLEHGHRVVAFVGSSPTSKTVTRRYEGFAEALVEAGARIRPEHVAWAGFGTPDAAPVLHRAVAGWSDVTAAFSAVARTTPGLLRALVEHDRRDVEVIAFDDMELADVAVPPVSALAQDAEAIGRHAARMLFERIGGLNGPARHVEVPLTLVDRHPPVVRTALPTFGAPAPDAPRTAGATARR